MNVPPPQSSRHLQPGDILFDLGIFLVSGMLLWICAQDPIFRVGSEAWLFVINGLMVYSLHSKPVQLKGGYPGLSACFVAGLGALVLGFLLEPLWWDFAVLFLGGQQQAAVMLLDRRPAPSGLVILPGLLAIYFSIVLLVRLTLARLDVLPEPYVFAWVRRREETPSA
jgi:hypothetical protein